MKNDKIYKIKNDKGYIQVLCPEHSEKSTKLVPEHRLVMEKSIGRKLTNNEVVHHINRERDDNRPENLVLFQSPSDHTRFHKYGILIINDTNVGCTSPKTAFKHICEYCSKQFFSIVPEQKFCSVECKAKASRKVDRPTKEELKILILKNDIRSIGEKYEVSGNAIRKWCKSYKLPFKDKDIKKYREKKMQSANRVRKTQYDDCSIVMESLKFANGNKRKTTKKIVFNNIQEACLWIFNNGDYKENDLNKIKSYITRVLKGQRNTFAGARWYSVDFHERGKLLNSDKLTEETIGVEQECKEGINGEDNK